MGKQAKKSVFCNEETGTLIIVLKWGKGQVEWTEFSPLSPSNEIYKPKLMVDLTNERGGGRLIRRWISAVVEDGGWERADNTRGG